VIRGISDLIDGKNDDSVEPERERQKKASERASAFAFAVLGKIVVEETGADPPDRDRGKAKLDSINLLAYKDVSGGRENLN